jgi:hypothetical protein
MAARCTNAAAPCYKARVSRYAAGFLTASVLWGAAAAVAWAVWLRPAETLVVASAPSAIDAGVAAEEAPRRRRRRRRGRKRGRGARSPGPSSAELARIETTGDDLGGAEPRTLDLEGSGGEEQLSGSQIESGMDAAMGGIRRCLVLAAGDEPVRGRLTFGLRVASSGRVGRVNLRGPRAVTGGECGDCLRRAARRARFPSFDGPDMVVHYPLTLE